MSVNDSEGALEELTARYERLEQAAAGDEDAATQLEVVLPIMAELVSPR